MMNVFLDLEETVIDEFKAHPTFLHGNCWDIRKFLEPMQLIQPQRLFIFSMAIDTEEEERIFAETICTSLLAQIDLGHIHKVITVHEMQEASQKLHKIRYQDMCEYVQINGKEKSFHDWCNLHHRGEVSFLIDDMVGNRTTHDNDHGTVISTLNVKRLFNRRVTPIL